MKRSHTRWTLMPLAALVLACGAGTQLSQQKAPAVFERIGELDPERFGLTATAVDQDIFLVGGSEFKRAYQGGLKGRVQRFHTADHRLEDLEIQVLPRRYHGAVAHEGRLFILGGVVPDRAVGDVRLMETDKLEIVDLVTGEVLHGAPLPHTRIQAATVLYDDKIYVIGGQRQGGAYHPIGSVDIYDIATNQWSEGAPLPTARACDAVVHAGKIYAVGGFNGFALRRIDVYDPASDQWEKAPDAPVALSAHRCCMVGDKLYTLGDYTQLNLVLSYDFETGQWSRLESNFLGRRHHAVAVEGQQVYIFGGLVGAVSGGPLGGVAGIQRFAQASVEMGP